jgi:hypothetical protein
MGGEFAPTATKKLVLYNDFIFYIFVEAVLPEALTITHNSLYNSDSLNYSVYFFEGHFYNHCLPPSRYISHTLYGP